MKRLLEQLLVKLFPTPVYRLIGCIYGYLMPAIISYSQYGEDLMIENFFKMYKKETGVYVDIGGFHPKWLSNTYRLYKKGWAGSAVDIDNYKIRLFELVRRNCLGFIGAVAPGQTSQEMTAYRFRRLWSEIDTLSIEDAKRYEKDFQIKFDPSKITTININEVLKKTTEKFGDVNFINIDIEGLDEAIIFEIDFNKYAPDLICFENNQSFMGSEKLKTFFTEKNYVHLFTSGGTHGYCKKAIVKI